MDRTSVPCSRVARLFVLSAVPTLALAFAGCSDDDGPIRSLTTGPDARDTEVDGHVDDVAPTPDASETDASETDAGSPRPDDAGGDPSDSHPPEPAPDVNPEPDDVVLEPEVPPDAGEGSDFLCNLDARLSACSSALLDPTAAPDDPSDLLYHVNRVREVPADWPLPRGAAWDPCQPQAAESDLVCLPGWATDGRPQSLRSAAWSSPAPEDLSTTHDGLPVGYEGRVGFDAMLRAGREEAGLELFVLSSFRPWERQHAIHESYVRREMETQGFAEDEARIVTSTYSAVPGHSEHQLGTTADLTFRTESGGLFPGLEEVMGASRAFRWMFRNAHRFGIVVTYAAHRVEVTQYVYEPWHVRYVGVEAADAMRACALNTEELLMTRYETGPPPEFAGAPYILFPALRLLGASGLLPGGDVRPGEAVEAGWRLRNSGTTNWWNATAFEVDPATGETLPETAEVDLPVCTIVGQEAEVQVRFDAPTEEGTYRRTWQLRDASGRDIQPPIEMLFRVTEAPSESSLRWVRIVDRSGRTSGETPGADIDAVLLIRDDDTFPAASVVRYAPAPSSPTTNDPSRALGLPDAYGAWPATDPCSVSAGFVSLGGAGELVVELGTGLRAGDRLLVLEVGGCLYNETSTAIADAIDVEVGATASGPWIPVASGSGPVIEALFE